MNQWVDRLSCCNAQDALMIMKYSDRLSDEYDRLIIEKNKLAMDHPDKDSFLVVAKQFYCLEPSMEFRVFVFENGLKGVCQRDKSHCYPYLQEKWGDLLVEKSRGLFSKINQSIPFSDCSLMVLILIFKFRNIIK